jgi:hypothetical protein
MPKMSKMTKKQKQRDTQRRVQTAVLCAVCKSTTAYGSIRFLRGLVLVRRGQWPIPEGSMVMMMAWLKQRKQERDVAVARVV